MFSEQKIRGALFYLSFVAFFAGLPFILSFALGYKFNPQTWKFYRTGLIYLKTQPEGARIYLNDKLIPEKTPARPLSTYRVLPRTHRLIRQEPQLRVLR